MGETLDNNFIAEERRKGTLATPEKVRLGDNRAVLAGADLDCRTNRTGDSQNFKFDF